VQWLDRSGTLEPLLATAGVYDWLRLSPDGKRLALVSDRAGNPDVWVYDLDRGALSRITLGGANENPVWSRDGKHLVYASGQLRGMVWARSDGSGEPQRFPAGSVSSYAASFSSDGLHLAFETHTPDAHVHISTVPLESIASDHPRAAGPEEPFSRTGSSEFNAAFSPDGRWLAYESDESGSSQIYVRPFPARSDAGKWQISADGGTTPIWAPDGRQLFHVSSDGHIMVTAVRTEDDVFVAEKPAQWSAFLLTAVRNTLVGSSNLDIARDGKRFAVLVPAGMSQQQPPTHLNVLFNFLDELKRKTSVG
jgi:Tol biopolymer transport system component